MTRQGNKRVMAKSLHTVTALARVALHILAYDVLSNEDAIEEAAQILGLSDQVDAYGLKAAALVALSKGAR